jgi:hypothetical protein
MLNRKCSSNAVILNEVKDLIFINSIYAVLYALSIFYINQVLQCVANDTQCYFV